MRANFLQEMTALARRGGGWQRANGSTIDLSAVEKTGFAGDGASHVPEIIEAAGMGTIPFRYPNPRLPSTAIPPPPDFPAIFLDSPDGKTNDGIGIDRTIPSGS